MGRWFTPSKSDNQSGAEFNRLYTEQSTIASSANTTGNLTDEQAQSYGNKKLFRLGTFFTSPSGALNSSPRRGTKLIGGA
jgi:hypothetical protein